MASGEGGGRGRGIGQLVVLDGSGPAATGHNEGEHSEDSSAG